MTHITPRAIMTCNVAPTATTPQQDRERILKEICDLLDQRSIGLGVSGETRDEWLDSMKYTPRPYPGGFKVYV